MLKYSGSKEQGISRSSSSECVENDITLVEICNTLRGVPAPVVWAWGEYVAEDFWKTIRRPR
jgi:hypothetical protein